MADIGETVLLHCIATLDDGTAIVDTRAAQRPLEVRIGSSALPAAVEVAASNLLPGGSARVPLAPAQAFGEHDEALVRRIPSRALSNADGLAVGKRVVLKTPAGDVDAKVVAADRNGVVVDCNHAYAGRSVVFDIELVSVVHEDAIHRELHPAGCGCGCDKLKAQIG